jgi:trans-aconitate 2-methyltransferase
MPDWDPELYNRFSAFRSEPVTMMLGRLQLEPCERIVDLGCGTGEHTVELARRCSEGLVVGIDSSPAMIERALKLRETLDSGLRQRLQFELADLVNFEADRQYTVIFSNAALQWVSDHRCILAAAYHALCDKGRLVIQMPANEHETAQLTMRQMATEAPWSGMLSGVRTPSDENVLSAAAYAEILAEIGFSEVSCFYHTFDHPMRSPTEVVEFCRSTSLRRFLDPLPPAQQSAFIALLTRRLETAYGSNGPLTFTFRRLFLWGRRLDTAPAPSH